MFSWYRKAAVCYVYLSDVDGSADFAKSRWFNRAWTLQELLAPCFGLGSRGFSNKLRFMNRSWHLLSTEATSSQVISHITGIPQGYLNGQSLEDASISMRMSWAAGREATRQEDIAYALLGIFDVNIPLLYGEGKVKAFRRLQEEIMKASEDETLFAWISAAATPQNVCPGFLAADPADFSMTKHLAPFHTKDSAVPHTMTHRGLHIRMQLFDAFDNAVKTWKKMQPIEHSRRSYFYDSASWGVLRCYLASDPTRLVLIPLEWQDSDMYIRHPCNILVTVPSRFVPDTVRFRDIYIRNSITRSIADSLRRRYAFVIRTLPHGASITHVDFADSWDPQTRIIQVYSTTERIRWWHASLELIMDLSSSKYLCWRDRRVVNLGLHKVSEDAPPEPWCHISDPTKPSLIDLQDLYQSTPLQSPHYTFSSCLAGRVSFPSVGLEVTMTPLKMYGQAMFVIDIESIKEEPKSSKKNRYQCLDSLKSLGQPSTLSEPPKIGHILRSWLKSSPHG
ncbi:hypothetical protein J1614_005837 [Plenodomus biglobosus]|nr:hypothetical protein J1614_005837 [Plenodomus biglobosus]